MHDQRCFVYKRYIKKAQSTMASYFVLLHLLNLKTTFKRNQTIMPISLTPIFVASGPLVVLDLSSCKPKAIQKPSTKIWHIIHLSINSGQGTKAIKIKSMNKNDKRKHHYFVFFNTSKDEAKAQIYSKWIISHFSQINIQVLISFLINVNCAKANAVLDANIG